MSTATTVPPTFDLEGDDARATLKRTGWGRLFKDSFLRFHAADGFSHSRALAYQLFLAATAGLIGIVALATAAEEQDTRNVLRETLRGVAPGPTGQIFTEAFKQGGQNGGGLALIAGLGVAVIAGTLGMAQIERGANRIYGIDQDRPTIKRYGLAVLLSLSAGLLILSSAVLLVAGPAIADAGRSAGGWSDALVTVWSIGRWPAGVLAIVVSMALLFRWAPRRHQPSPSWLAAGSLLSVVLWLAFTVALALYINASGSFGSTYGPLAGIIGLLLWANLSSIALYMGLAFAAQLEAVRAGVPEPEWKDGSQDRFGLGSRSESLTSQDDGRPDQETRSRSAS